MLAVIDNYDSFTYNLVQMLGESTGEVFVIRNDSFTITELKKKKPSAIVISPGPGMPHEAGLSMDVVRSFASTTPILGVCLGHQTAAACFGAKITGAPELFHGKASEIFHHGDPLFKEVDNPFSAARYHSLHVERSSIPDCLEIIAETAEGLVMALRHKEYPLYGVQFHPESFITPQGRIILNNFLKGANDFAGISCQVVCG